MFSIKAKYAVKAMIVLADRHRQGPVRIAELARQENLPKKFLELILLDLKNRGLLYSRKGRGGGYYLQHDPQAIRIGTIIEMIDGLFAPPSCVIHSSVRTCSSCEDSSGCGLKLVMDKLRQAIMDCLNGMTLTDLVEHASVRQTDRGTPYEFQI